MPSRTTSGKPLVTMGAGPTLCRLGNGSTVVDVGAILDEVAAKEMRVQSTPVKQKLKKRTRLPTTLQKGMGKRVAAMDAALGAMPTTSDSWGH